MARQFNSAGTHLGYRYVDSPIVVRDETPEPPDDPNQVVPSTWPGSRAPHAWLGSDTSIRGASTLDWFGLDFVLVAATGADGGHIAQALEARKVPHRVVTIPDPKIEMLFERPLVLVRPDGHVAWRGISADAHAAEMIVARVTGHEQGRIKDSSSPFIRDA